MRFHPGLTPGHLQRSPVTPQPQTPSAEVHMEVDLVTTISPTLDTSDDVHMELDDDHSTGSDRFETSEGGLTSEEDGEFESDSGVPEADSDSAYSDIYC